MEGGFDAWQKSDFAVESGEVAAAPRLFIAVN
jgi:hypothetical protein